VKIAIVRAVAGLAAACAFAVPLLTVLHARVPETRQRPLFEPGPSDRLGPFEIDEDRPAPGAAGSGVHTARLAVHDVEALTKHQRILLTVATYGTVAHLRDAVLSFGGTTCTYRTAGDTEIADNYSVAFERQPACAGSDGRPAGDATLVFRLRNRARIALAAFVGSPPPDEALVLMSPDLSAAHLTPILQGDSVDVDIVHTVARGDLLAYLWNIRATDRWIDGVIALAGVLVGCAVLVGWPVPFTGWRTALRLAAAAFIAAFAVSLSYAVLCPPFQVADEPSHFLVLASYINRADLADAAEPWAQRNQFEEIRFHPQRTFSPADRGRTGRPWSDVSVPMRDLYGAVRIPWRWVGPIVSGMDLPHAFLAVRLVHALGFACAVAAFVLLVTSSTASAASMSAALPLLLVPTLPQFGMHVSNYALLLDACVVIAAGMVIASWDGPRTWVAGPLLGLGFGVAIGMSRSALPMWPLVAAVLTARVVLGSRTPGRLDAYAFWSGLAVLLAATLMLIQRPYVNEIHLSGSRIAAAATALTLLLRYPLLVLPLGAAALVSERLCARARRRIAYRPAAAVVRGTALGGAIGLFVLSAASLVVTYPVLPLYLTPNRPSSTEYTYRAVLACATFLRFGRPDWLTSTTFFAGFGWLDMVPPIGLVSTLAGASGLMLVVLLLWVAWTRSTRALIWFGLAAAGFLFSAAAYGLGIIRGVPSDLHGRYLLGLYVCTLALCWTGLGRAAGSGSSRRSAALTAAATAGVVAVNVYSLHLILARYFS
jgi:hypothetical protein